MHVSEHPELQDLASKNLRELQDQYAETVELLDAARNRRDHADRAYWLVSRAVLAVHIDERIDQLLYGPDERHELGD